MFHVKQSHNTHKIRHKHTREKIDMKTTITYEMSYYIDFENIELNPTQVTYIKHTLTGCSDMEYSYSEKKGYALILLNDQNPIQELEVAAKASEKEFLGLIQELNIKGE